jgi:hypothetical protein
MDKASWQGSLVFLGKVVGLSALMAIAIKAIAPQFPIPVTSSVSLAIVLAPPLIMGAILCWQLWRVNHADPPHP